MTIRLALFDLDGTLLDTAPDLVGALNHVRDSEGLDPVPLADFRALVSQGAAGLIRHGLPPADDGHFEHRRRAFLDYYRDHLLEDTRPFAGVERMLTQLEAQGVPWGVVTNKPEFLTHPILEGIGWNSRAACVVCGDTLPRSKPDPAPVRLACEQVGRQPAETLMVGDDPRDLEAARAAGAVPVLATYGYGAAALLASGEAVEHRADRPGDVIPLLRLSREAQSA